MQLKNQVAAQVGDMIDQMNNPNYTPPPQGQPPGGHHGNPGGRPGGNPGSQGTTGFHYIPANRAGGVPQMTKGGMNQAGGYQAQGQAAGYQSRQGYGAQQGAYGAQQGAYGAQQGAYGAQQGAYGTQAGGYGTQQAGYGTQQAGYGTQAGQAGRQGTQPQAGYGAAQQQKQNLGRQQLSTDRGGYSQTADPYQRQGSPRDPRYDAYGAQKTGTAADPYQKQGSPRSARYSQDSYGRTSTTDDPYAKQQIDPYGKQSSPRLGRHQDTLHQRPELHRGQEFDQTGYAVRSASSIDDYHGTTKDQEHLRGSVGGSLDRAYSQDRYGSTQKTGLDAYKKSPQLQRKPGFTDPREYGSPDGQSDRMGSGAYSTQQTPQDQYGMAAHKAGVTDPYRRDGLQQGTGYSSTDPRTGSTGYLQDQYGVQKPVGTNPPGTTGYSDGYGTHNLDQSHLNDPYNKGTNIVGSTQRSGMQLNIGYNDPNDPNRGRSPGRYTQDAYGLPKADSGALHFYHRSQLHHPDGPLGRGYRSASADRDPYRMADGASDRLGGYSDRLAGDLHYGASNLGAGRNPQDVARFGVGTQQTGIDGTSYGTQHGIAGYQDPNRSASAPLDQYGGVAKTTRTSSDPYSRTDLQRTDPYGTGSTQHGQYGSTSATDSRGYLQDGYNFQKSGTAGIDGTTGRNYLTDPYGSQKTDTLTGTATSYQDDRYGSHKDSTSEPYSRAELQQKSTYGDTDYHGTSTDRYSQQDRYGRQDDLGYNGRQHTRSASTSHLEGYSKELEYRELNGRRHSQHGYAQDQAGLRDGVKRLDLQSTPAGQRRPLSPRSPRSPHSSQRYGDDYRSASADRAYTRGDHLSTRDGYGTSRDYQYGGSAGSTGRYGSSRDDYTTTSMGRSGPYGNEGDSQWLKDFKKMCPLDAVEFGDAWLKYDYDGELQVMCCKNNTLRPLS